VDTEQYTQALAGYGSALVKINTRFFCLADPEGQEYKGASKKEKHGTSRLHMCALPLVN
jgi:hypothetical protein